MHATVSILIDSSKANTRWIAARPKFAQNVQVALTWIKRTGRECGTAEVSLTCHADVICSSIAQYYRKFLCRY
jgi:hypothetical protein